MDLSLTNENNNNNCGNAQNKNLKQIENLIKASCSDDSVSRMEGSSKQTDVGTRPLSSVNDEAQNECLVDKTTGPISSRIVQQNITQTVEANNNNTNNANTDSTGLSSPQGPSKLNNHIEIKPLTSFLNQEHRQRTKKFSHPIFVPPAGSVNISGGNDNLHNPATSSALFTNQYKDASPKFNRHVMQSHAIALGTTSGGGSRSPVMRRIKKHSMPVVPILSLNDAEEDEEEDVTKRLETAVRRISRGSPNRQAYGGNSPLMGRTSPNRFTCSSQDESPVGLSGLARGYEQYREWLTTLRPTTEFGEPSSDDLSSEWESSHELELVRAYSSSMTLKSSLSSATNTPPSINTQINSHPAVRRRKSAEDRKKELQKKGHYRRPADDAIDDDDEEEDERKNKNCAMCRGDTIPEGDVDNNEEARKGLLHHKQHSMKRVCEIIIDI